MILALVEVVKNIKNVVVNNEEVLSYFYTDHFDSYLHFLSNNLLPHPKYTNDDFGIQTYKSITDQDHDGIDDQSDIVQNVRKYIETKPQYKSKYYQGGYPTDHYGVCSDVVAFGLFECRL